MTQILSLNKIGYVKIGNHTVDIKFVPDPALYYKTEEKDTLYGFFDPESLTIYIREQMKMSLIKDTLWHEIMHAIWLVSGAAAIESEQYSEEMMISILSPWFITFIEDNPQLLELF